MFPGHPDHHHRNPYHQSPISCLLYFQARLGDGDTTVTNDKQTTNDDKRKASPVSQWSKSSTPTQPRPGPGNPFDLSSSMSRVTLYQLWCRSGSRGLCGVQRGFRGEEEISGKKSRSHLKVDKGGTFEDLCQIARRVAPT